MAVPVLSAHSEQVVANVRVDRATTDSLFVRVDPPELACSSNPGYGHWYYAWSSASSWQPGDCLLGLTKSMVGTQQLSNDVVYRLCAIEKLAPDPSRNSSGIRRTKTTLPFGKARYLGTDGYGIVSNRSSRVKAVRELITLEITR
jgi:hypothetical protein